MMSTGTSAADSGNESIPEDLKAEHLLVLLALEDGNRDHGRAVSRAEVLQQLDEEDRGVLAEAYAEDLGPAVGRVLRLLYRRPLVFSPGKQGRKRYYGSKRVLDPGSAKLSDEMKSKRARAMDLARRRVSKLGRAVRMADMQEAPQEHLRAGNRLTPKDVRESIQSLHATGDLVAIGEVPGDGAGRKLYLPKDFADDVAEYRPEEPLTWREEVLDAFRECWRRKKIEAEEADRLPEPVVTGEVRAVVESRQPDHPKLENPQLLINALQGLARGDNQRLRKIRRPGRISVLWVPAEIDDDGFEVAGTYAHDTERIEEAVRRAEERRNLPAVTLEQIRYETQRDLALEPRGEHALYEALGDVTKETVADGNGGRVRRVDQRVRKVGAVEGTAYYSTVPSEWAAEFVSLLALEAGWEKGAFKKRLSGLREVQLPTVKLGRIRTAGAQLSELVDEAERLMRLEGLPDRFRERAAALGHEAEKLISMCHKREASVAKDGFEPEGIQTEHEGWTAEEVRDVLGPLFYRVNEETSSKSLIPLLDWAILRVPNPAFESRRSGEHHTACEYLFERTSTLLYAARRWGGREAALQASTAGTALGRLRDLRYVLPALERTDADSRLTAIACMAFLQDDRALPHLRRVAHGDPRTGVRDSACWAYGFIGGEDVAALVEETTERDQPGLAEAVLESTNGKPTLADWIRGPGDPGRSRKERKTELAPPRAGDRGG